MKTLIWILSVCIFMIGESDAISREIEKPPSFSFHELESAKKVPLPPLQHLGGGDKTMLAYRVYKPRKIKALLIFYHGGGSYGAGGYEHIGDGLSRRFNVLVVTPDLRGHGDSEGERGDAPRPEQVFDDIGVFIRHLREKYPHKALFLGGHSSGGGLLLNYSSYRKRESVEGYLFLSPHLGFRSKTEIENNPNPFATVKTELFVENAIHGTQGNSKAVFFNYSKEVLKRNKNIPAITVNMSNAQTPTAPRRQLRELTCPAALWIGSKDEVLDARKVASFFRENHPEAFVKIVDKVKHLSILLTAADHMGPWIGRHVK